MSDEVVDFIGVGDDVKVVFTFGLTEFELTGEGRDVGVGSVAPKIVEESLNIELLLVGNDVPISELLDHCRNGLILVSDIVFG